MIAAMPRWDPRAKDRLRDAALELFLEHRYENVTVAQITERAGLTRRTFSRYFTDKRDVLFAGSEQLPVALADAVRHADDALPPFGALLTALVDIGELLDGRVPHAAQRRAVLKASPELQERERTKFAAVTGALAAALQQRGAAESGRGSSRQSARPSSRPRSSAGPTSRNAQTFRPASARRPLSLPPAWEQSISPHFQARDVSYRRSVGGTVIRAILNVVWLVFCGLWMAILYVAAGLVCFVLIITIPFGIAAFRIAGYVLWPFGRTIVRRPDAGAGSMIGNILWIILFGWWLALGHLVTGILLCLTIIGIPLAAGSFKIIPITLLPLGTQIVPVDRVYADAA